MRDLKEIARECKRFIPDWEWHDADCIVNRTQAIKQGLFFSIGKWYNKKEI